MHVLPCTTSFKLWALHPSKGPQHWYSQNARLKMPPPFAFHVGYNSYIALFIWPLGFVLQLFHMLVSTARSAALSRAGGYLPTRRTRHTGKSTKIRYSKGRSKREVARADMAKGVVKVVAAAAAELCIGVRLRLFKS